MGAVRSPRFDFAGAGITLASMQTAAVAPTEPAFSSLRSSQFPSSAAERVPPYWDEEREEWVGTPTEEEKFAALKEAAEEGFDEIDAGLGIRISSEEELRAFIHDVSEEAGARARARREAQQLACAS